MGQPKIPSPINHPNAQVGQQMFGSTQSKPQEDNTGSSTNGHALYCLPYFYIPLLPKPLALKVQDTFTIHHLVQCHSLATPHPGYGKAINEVVFLRSNLLWQEKGSGLNR